MSRTGRGHRSWLAGSLREFASWASRPAQLDGGGEEARNVAFLLLLGSNIQSLVYLYVKYMCMHSTCNFFSQNYWV
jgi:hypothetical protein